MIRSQGDTTQTNVRKQIARTGVWGSALVVWLLAAGGAVAEEPIDRAGPGSLETSSQRFPLESDSASASTTLDASDDVSTALGGKTLIERGGQEPVGGSAIRRDAAGQRSSPFELGSGPWYRSGLVSICVVLALVWLIYKAARRWIPGSKVPDSGLLNVVARTTLTPKQHVALVRLGRRFVMVGVSPDRIDQLCVVDDAEEVSELIIRTDGGTVPRSSEFDLELSREMSDYDLAHERDVDRDAVLGAPGTPCRPPLQELLNRLQSLQRG